MNSNKRAFRTSRLIWCLITTILINQVNLITLKYPTWINKMIHSYLPTWFKCSIIKRPLNILKTWIAQKGDKWWKQIKGESWCPTWGNQVVLTSFKSGKTHHLLGPTLAILCNLISYNQYIHLGKLSKWISIQNSNQIKS